jgi:hypothetical protein
MNSGRAHSVPRFQAAVPAVILANSVVLGWGWIDHAHDVAAERIDTCFLVFFAAELAVRLKRAGWRWLTQPWNLLDATIILMALLPVVGNGITILRLSRAARLLHLGRHTSHLRVVAWLGRRTCSPVPADDGSSGRRATPLLRGHSAWVFECCSGLVDLVICVRHHLGRSHHLTLVGERFVGRVAEDLAQVGDRGGELGDC